MDLVPEIFAELKEGRVPPAEVLTLVATRFVGYAMTLCACFVKLPQILKIYKHKSGKGLSVASFELEVVICLIHVFYCYLTDVPFSSYGEAVAALIQNVIIVSLLYQHCSVSMMRRTAVLASLAAFSAFALSGELSVELITSAFLMNQVIFVFGRGMQIVKTAWEKDASQLSVTSYAMPVIGKAIRILTSLKEGASLTLLYAHLIGFTMNMTAVLQILYYNRKVSKAKRAN